MLTSPVILGQVTTTASIHALMHDDLRFHTFVYMSISRHESGDWGDLSEEDHSRNELALISGTRLFSAYECGPALSQYGQRIYIITEADRSSTTVLWPREY